MTTDTQTATNREPMVINIDYDRREKVYVWTDPETGEVFQFPNGPQGKAQARQFVISMLDPDLYAAATGIITRHPQLERATWKAVELVIENGVEFVQSGNVMAMVNSSDGFGRYAITSDNGYTACQCEHFTSFSAPMTQEGNRYCKHILAYHLWLTCRAEF